MYPFPRKLALAASAHLFATACITLLSCPGCGIIDLCRQQDGLRQTRCTREPRHQHTMSERQRLYRTHALVLRRRDYQDADRILTVFTPNYGKIDLIAKGARKTTSRKAGHLELFGHTSLLVAQARTWDIVTEAVTVASFGGIRVDLEKISQASYLCELIDCFTESGDDNLPLWDLILFALEQLDQQSNIQEANLLLRWFELHLLTHAGFEPQLFSCLACDEELQPVTNYINLLEGGVLCPTCGQYRRDVEAIEADVLKVMRFLQSRSWQAVRQVNVREHILRRVNNLIYRYLLTVLERQLKSVDFIRQLENMAAIDGPREDSAEDAPFTDLLTPSTPPLSVATTGEESYPHAHS